MEAERVLIQLNSFVHRVDDKVEVVRIAAQTGCELKRIRRSRHWQIAGQVAQLQRFAKQVSITWITAKIEQACEKYKPAIDEILELNPNISVLELVQHSGCSVAEARVAIDQHEGF